MFASLRCWLAPKSQARTKPARTLLGCDSMEDRSVPSANPLASTVGHTVAAASIFGSGAGSVDDQVITPQVDTAAGLPGAGASLGSQGGQLVTTPFFLSGDCFALNGMPLTPGLSVEYGSTGTVTMLGRHTGSGVFTLGSLSIDETGHVTGTFSGSYTFVAANGDKLVTNYGVGPLGTFSGRVAIDANGFPQVVNLVFDTTFVVDSVQSTGRFAGATGSFHMIATAPVVSLASDVPGWTAPFTFSWVGDGELTTQKGKK